MTHAIEFHNVSKQFNLSSSRATTLQEQLIHFVQRRGRSQPSEPFWVLRDVSFSIPQGQSVGLIGWNGSGKSTSLKLLTGILYPTKGEIIVRGRTLALLELGTGMHPDLSGRENIFLNGSLLGISADEVRKRFDAIAAFSEIDPTFLDMPVKHYSSGMYVRLAFSVAIHFDPEILVVDEVLAVGDLGFQRKCLARIGEMRRKGVTIVIVSHDLGTMQKFCDRLIWFDAGRVRADGPPTDVAMQYTRATAQRPDEAVGQEAPADGAPVADGAPDEQRWGTGEVQIEGVEFCDEAGVERRAFTSASAMQIRLHYRARERVADPIFGVAVHDDTGVLISGPNSGLGGQILTPAIEGAGVVTLTIPSLPLLQGNYLLSVSCHPRDESVMFDYHDRLYPFSVYPGGNHELHGVMSLGGQWAMAEGVPQPQPAAAVAEPVALPHP